MFWLLLAKSLKKFAFINYDNNYHFQIKFLGDYGYMSVAIIGGLDRLKRTYERECLSRGFDARVFSQRIPNMARRMNGVERILIFTGTVAHPMVTEAVRVGKEQNIPVERSHSSSISALKRCLNRLS
jgi:hypothetical protein